MNYSTKTALEMIPFQYYTAEEAYYDVLCDSR